MASETRANFSSTLAHTSLLLLIIHLVERREPKKSRPFPRCRLPLASAVAPTWPAPSFMKSFLRQRKSVSRELQKSRLQNVKFQQEAGSLNVVFGEHLRFQKKPKNIWNLKGILLFMFMDLFFRTVTCLIHIHFVKCKMRNPSHMDLCIIQTSHPSPL